MLHNQHNALLQFSVQPQIQLPQLVQNKVLQPSPLPLQSGNTTVPSTRPQPQGNFSFRPHIPVSTSSSLKQHVQAPLLQHPLQVATSSNLVYSKPQLTHPPMIDHGFQHSCSPISGVPDNISRNPRKQVTMSRMTDSLETTNYLSKLVRPNDARTLSWVANKHVAIAGSGQPQNFSTCLNQFAKAEEASPSEKQVTQMQLPPEVESALLQQVMNLTPEQLSSLPPDQQQQVIQLQQMLRQAT